MKPNLDSSTVEWLLDSGEPSVRYWSLLDLDDKPPNHPEVREAQDSIMESSAVKTILESQAEEGYWVTEKDMYLPKYKATTHSLLILSELGAKRTKKIEKAMEHIFRFQRDSGHFLPELPITEKGKASIVKDGCCFDGNILYYSILFGYIDDRRVQRLIDFIVDYHDQEEAGWRCRSYPINPDAVFPRNCYMGATKILKALSVIPPKKRTGKIKEVINREQENILENGVDNYLRNSDGSRKEKKGWKKFGFPLFYQSDTLEVLDTLTRLGIRDDRMVPAIDLLLSLRQPDGRWRIENTYNGKMWVDIESRGKPSRWVTLRAMRVLKRFY